MVLALQIMSQHVQQSNQRQLQKLQTGVRPKQPDRCVCVCVGGGGRLSVKPNQQRISCCGTPLSNQISEVDM
jgi:hypothetical protein